MAKDNKPLIYVITVQRRYDNRAPGSTSPPLICPSLLPLVELSRDSETEITVKSAASL